MTSFVVDNNVESTVADNPLTAAALTLNVAAGEGANFPSTFPYRLTIWNESTYSDPSDDSTMEVVEVTGRTTDALTISRGEEGTTGVEHVLGMRVAMLITAGLFNDATYGITTKLDGIASNAIANLVEDTTPQLGGNLDTNSKSINAIDQTNAIENTSKLLQIEDIFSDFVVTGLLPADSANLTSDISAGHAYVTGTRVNKVATANTYTANKHTWVDINSVGAYTFPSSSNTILVEDCEDAWNELVNANVTSSLEATIIKVGAGSAKFALNTSVAAGDILATEAIASTNISGADSIRFWIRSSVATAAGDLQLLLDETAECASPSEALNVPALVIDTWKEVTVSLTAPAADLDAIISVGIKCVVDLGAHNLYIDDIQAVLPAPATPAITADSIRLAKVVTDSIEITEVTSLRELQGIFVGRNININGLLSQAGLGGSTYFGHEAGKVDDLSNNNNTGIGYQALTANTTGVANTALGYATLKLNSTGNYNTAIGYWTLYANETGLRNIALGFYAGRYELGSDAFYINNQDRTNTAGDKAKSIIYGIMAAAVADQRLVFNADVKVTGRLKKSATAAITAYASGGQANAVLLASDINEVSVCASAADSVKLPGALAGMEIMVVNRGAAAMNLFPAVGDYVNELAVDTAVSIAIDATAIAFCYIADRWEVVEVTRA